MKRNKILFFYFFIFLFSVAAFPASAYLPSDPLYATQQTYLDGLNIRQAWDIAKGNGAIVAVLDSGVDITHPDLKFNIWNNINEIARDGIDNDKNGYVDDVNGYDFVDQDGDPSPVLDDGYTEGAISHGTAVAGIIGAVADNGEGMAGIAFNAKIMPLRVLKGNGEGNVSDLVSAIDYAILNGANVINLSLVGEGTSSEFEMAIRRAYNKNVVVVAAAGNTASAEGGTDLNQTSLYPVCYGNGVSDNIILGVASINDKDIKSAFSNYGSNCVDFATIGEKVNSLAYYNPSADFDNLYSYNWAGTSFSSAVTAGVAALVKSNNPLLTSQQVISSLLQGTDNIDNINPDYIGQLGRGQLNAWKALNVDFGPAKGRLIKLKNDSAVYYVRSGVKRLFSNAHVFWSWYTGSWTDAGIEIVSQEEFDSYDIGRNVTVRPGTNLIKFQNSGRIYAVAFNQAIHYIAEAAALKLYGDNWRDRLRIIQNGFESDYARGDDLDGSIYPDGTLVKYDGSGDLWLIQNGEKRLLKDQSFTDNNFNDKYLIDLSSVADDLAIGRPVSGVELSLYEYYK